MIHCDIDDTIREIKFIQENFLLCAHNKCLNVWKLKNEDKTSTESQLLKRGGDVDGFTEIACVWSKTCDDEVVEIKKEEDSKIKNDGNIKVVELSQCDKCGKKLTARTLKYTHNNVSPANENKTHPTPISTS